NKSCNRTRLTPLWRARPSTSTCGRWPAVKRIASAPSAAPSSAPSAASSAPPLASSAPPWASSAPPWASSDGFIGGCVAGVKNQLAQRPVYRGDPGDIIELEAGLLAGVMNDQGSAAEDPVVEVLLVGDIGDPAQRDHPARAGQQAALLDQALIGDGVRPCQPAQKGQHRQPHDEHDAGDNDPAADPAVTPPIARAAGRGRQKSRQCGHDYQPDERQEQRLDMRAH